MLTLDHAVFPVQDAAATLKFYRETLDLPLVDCLSGKDWGGYPWLMMIFGLGGGQEIVCVALSGAPAPEYRALPRDVRHYAFSVASADEWLAWRVRLMAAAIGAWEERHGDRLSVYFPDPDGVILEITHPAAQPGRNESREALDAARNWIGPTIIV